MFPYYVIIISGFLLCPFDFIRDRTLQLYMFSGYVLLLLFFAALRKVGTDNDSVLYQEIFQTIDHIDWASALSGKTYRADVEFGFAITNKVIALLGGNFRSLIMLMAFLSCVSNSVVIFKRSPYPFSSLLFYVCFFYFYRDFTQIRYAVSGGFLMIALFSFLDKKYIRYIIFQFLAISFHNSAWIGCILIIVYLIYQNRLFFLIFPLFGFIEKIIDPVDIMFSLLNLPLQLKKYLLEDFGQSGYMLSIVAQIILIGCFIFYKKTIQHVPSRYIRLLFIATSISSFTNLLFFHFAIMQRLSYLLFGCSIFLVAYVLRSLEMTQDDKYIALALYGIFNCFLLYYGIKMVDPALMRPYQTILWSL